MRFLVDECTGPKVARWLRETGHEVFCIFEQARGTSDDWIMHKASVEDWVLITSDKDFGEKVHREQRAHKGIILLRLDDERTFNKVNVLERLFAEYGDKLAGHFIVATETRVRLAPILGKQALSRSTR